MSPRSRQPDDLRRARQLSWGFAGLVALVLGLIVLGALVRAHGAGLACPDWPLCFGRLVPEMNLKVGFEWSHRLLAGGVALAFALLAAATLRRPALRARVGTLLGVAALLLALQIVLGALTVWQLLAAWSVTAHLVTGNAFNACLLLVALELRRQPTGARSQPVPAAVRSLLAIAAALFGLQVVLGGLVSSTYAGLVCPDWPACRDGLWFPGGDPALTLHLLHRWNGLAVLAALAAAAAAARGLPGLGGLALLALGLTCLQMSVGIANVLGGIPVEVTGLHSALAALLVLCLAALLREAFARAPTAPR